MDIAAAIESLTSSLAITEGWLLQITAPVVPVLMILGLRTLFMFRKHHSWVTFAVRFFGGAIPLCIGLYFLSVLVGSQDIRIVPGAGWGISVSFGLGLVIGVILAYIAGRKFEPWLLGYLDRRVRRAGRCESLTDIREVRHGFSDLADVDFSAQFDSAVKKDAMFLGLGLDGEEVTIDRPTWKSSHVQIMGPPGTGKGMLAGITLTQSLKYGDAVFVFDPKRDEWAPSVLHAACERAGVPFRYVDLNEAVAQINPLLSSTSGEVAEMLYAGLELGRKGTEADFYRLDDRKAARLAAGQAGEDALSLKELADRAKSVTDGSLMTGAKAFFAAIDEVAELPCVQTREGVDLCAPLRGGGCIYIVGSMRNDPIVILQKMLFVRIVQIIERMRERTRHCSVFLDEFKYLLSVTAVNSLGAIRDKGCNILLAHQSLGDFGNCGSDLSESAVGSTILDTTPIKWLYRPADQATASWVSDQSGRILVATQRAETARNPELAESLSEVRRIGEVERNLYDVNTVMSMPKGCAVCIGAGIATLARAKAIRVDRMDFRPTPAEVAEPVGINVLKRITASTVADDDCDTPSEPLLDQAPETRLLRFLFEETWTHIDIIRDLLGDGAQEQWMELLAALAEGKSIRCHELRIGSSSTGDYWGITRKGVDEYQLISGVTADRPIFVKKMLNPKSVLHRLDLQRLRLVAERAGWSQWQMQRPAGLLQKSGIYPDATVRDRSGARVAIEVERSVKTKSDYRKILLGHLLARRARRWDWVCYLSPDRSMAKRLERIFTDIEEVDYEGSRIEIGEDHRAVFQFFSYGDDWTESS
ncbi:MAG: TraM recognition domain-containing protein [Acidiferrobacterales bacterium]|nr:TraM recognition domain-containing protein [Acidiferrobacterales bacterium]